MNRDGLAKLVEIHKERIAAQATAKLMAQDLRGYTRISNVEIFKSYLLSLQVFAGYIRSDDLEGYRHYTNYMIAEQYQMGLSMSEIIATGDTLFAQIKETIERELFSPTQASVRTAYIQRLNRLTLFGRTAAINNNHWADKKSA